MNDKLEKIYQYLSTQNIKNFPTTYPDFETLMQDDDKAGKIHSFLLSKKVKNVDTDFNTFSDYIGRKKKSPSFIDYLESGQKSAFGLPPSPEPSKEFLTQPQPSVSKKDRNTTVIGDLGRTFSSTSKRMLGGIAGTPMLVNRTLATVTIRPILKAMGMSDEEASQATDQIIQSNTMGQMSGMSAQAQKVLNKSAQRNEAKMTQIEGTIWDNLTKGKDGEKDLGAAFEQLGRGIVGFAPYSLMTMATAGAGTVPVLATVGATAASQQYSELEERKDLKEGTKVLNSWLYGGLEGLGEAASAVIFRGIGKLFKQAVAKKLPDNLIKSLAKGMAEAVGLESSSEVVTQIGQNLTDIMTGVDPERNVFDGVVDVALTSAGFGLVTGGMGGAGAAILGRTLASDKEIQQVQDNVQQEAVLIDQIEETDSDPVKKALESRLKTLRYEADKIKDKNYELAKTLSPEQQQKVAELYSTWNELQGKIDSGQLTEQEVTTLESAVEGIKSEIESVKEAQIEKLAEIKKKDAKFKIGDDTFETEGAVEAWLDKNYQKRGLPPIWHTPTEKVIDAWYKRNKEEIDKRELQPLFKTEEETKDAEGTGTEITEPSQQAQGLVEGEESGLRVRDVKAISKLEGKQVTPTEAVQETQKFTELEQEGKVEPPLKSKPISTKEEITQKTVNDFDFTDTEKKLIQTATERRGKPINTQDIYEFAEKIAKQDNKPRSIEHTAEAINYASQIPSQFYEEKLNREDGSLIDFVKSAIGNRALGDAQAARILELNLNKEWNNVSKKINDAFLKIQEKTKGLNEQARRLLSNYI